MVEYKARFDIDGRTFTGDQPFEARESAAKTLAMELQEARGKLKRLAELESDVEALRAMEADHARVSEERDRLLASRLGTRAQVRMLLDRLIAFDHDEERAKAKVESLVGVTITREEVPAYLAIERLDRTLFDELVRTRPSLQDLAEAGLKNLLRGQR